jgi:uncharacterized protein YegJ (DUF2314 family)
MSKKKLYYTVEKEIDDNGGDDTLTGNKTITVYEIVNNEPKKLTDIECGTEENSKDKINDYLSDNGYGDDEFTLILL